MTNLNSSNDAAGRFTPGELVDVTIRGARVIETYLTSVMVASPIADFDGYEFPFGPNVTVTRVAPAEWPPQPGDVWFDASDRPWSALADLETETVEMSRSDDLRAHWSYPDEVLASFGPMRLEYRHGWKPAPAADIWSTPDEPAAVDKRAEQIAGLRELADLLEANPHLHYDPNDITIGTHNADELRDWATALGVEVTANPHKNTIQWWANKYLHGLKVHAYWIDESPNLGEDEPGGPAPTQDDEPDEVDQGDADDAALESMLANPPTLADTYAGIDAPAPMPTVDEYERATAADVVAAMTDDRGDAERIAQIEEDAAERRALDAEIRAELDDARPGSFLDAIRTGEVTFPTPPAQRDGQ